MRRDLVIAAGPGEWRTAVLEDDIPVELLVERGDGDEIGSVHLGRVVRLVPALAAMLVDIGGDRPGFLAARDVVPRARQIAEGERVIVQVRREAQAGKGARLTMAVSLRGRDVELRHGRPGLVGAETLSPPERTRLLGALTEALAPIMPRRCGASSTYALRPPPFPSVLSGEGGSEPGDVGGAAGLGLRMLRSIAGDGAVEEAAMLARRWRRIHQFALELAPPTRLDPAATFAAALAARTAAPDRVLLDDPAIIPEIRAAFPRSQVEQQKEGDRRVDLDAAYDEALASTVPLGLGSMHIETTRAAVLIDIDTGTPTAGSPEREALSTNLAAAREIARHLRLRNLSGGIVVDFVGLDRPGPRERVRAAVAEALVRDPASPRLLGWTRLGHLELVRPRRGRPLAEVLLDQQPVGAPRKSAKTMAFEALRALCRAARAEPSRDWRLAASPDVAAVLGSAAADALEAVKRRLGREICVCAEPRLARERFDVTAM